MILSYGGKLLETLSKGKGIMETEQHFDNLLGLECTVWGDSILEGEVFTIIAVEPTNGGMNRHPTITMVSNREGFFSRSILDKLILTEDSRLLLRQRLLKLLRRDR